MLLLNKVICCQNPEKMNNSFYQKLYRQRREFESRRINNLKSFYEALKKMSTDEIEFVKEKSKFIKQQIEEARVLYEPIYKKEEEKIEYFKKIE